MTWSQLQILFVMMSAVAMLFIDQTGLQIALPTMQRELGLQDLDLQWILNAYFLAITCCLLPAGRLGDLWGHRRAFFLGSGLFALSSLFCAVSGSATTLIFARALQGVGGALLFPATAALLTATFAPHQQGRARGYYIAAGYLCLAMGPYVAGLLTEYWSWRLIFWINLPVALYGIIGAYFLVPKSKKQVGTFEWLRYGLLALGIGALITGLMQGGIVWPLGALLLVFLVLHDLFSSHSFLHLRAFKNPLFAGCNVNVFLMQLMLMSTVFWALYFQNALHFSAAEAGLISLIANLPSLFFGPIAGHLVDRFGPKKPVMMGFSLMAITAILWYLMPKAASPWLLILITAPFRMGIPLIAAPSVVSALKQVPSHIHGASSALTMAIRQFGSTLGLALFSILFSHVQMKNFTADLASKPETASLQPKTFEGLLARAPEAESALQALPESVQVWVSGSFLESYVEAFSTLNAIVFLIGLFGLIASIILLRKGKGRGSEIPASLL